MKEPENLSRRLLGLMRWGCWLEPRDGHIWIEESDSPIRRGEWGSKSWGKDTWNLSAALKKRGLYLNNKIYGGVLEALDTIDECLKMCGLEPLETWWDEDIYRLGEGGSDMSRIDESEIPGEGGLI